VLPSPHLPPCQLAPREDGGEELRALRQEVDEHEMAVRVQGEAHQRVERRRGVFAGLEVQLGKQRDDVRDQMGLVHLAVWSSGLRVEGLGFMAKA